TLCRVDARRHAADGERIASVQLEARSIWMERSSVARTAGLERNHAARSESARRLPCTGGFLVADALIYWRVGSPSVSAVPAQPLVLVVEDDRDGRLLVLEWLSDAGFRVEQAHNGLQALERAIDLVPDAVLTDLHLPGIDGYELTRRLKTDARTTSIPVLAVTGYGPFTQDPSRAERAG